MIMFALSIALMVAEENGFIINGIAYKLCFIGMFISFIAWMAKLITSKN
jgi:hypothetical protein